MHTVFLLLMVMFVSVCTGADVAAAEGNSTEGKATEEKSRKFQLRYGATLRGLEKFHQVRVWLPVPASGGSQQVAMVGTSLGEGSYQVNRGRKFGNSILYFELEPAPEEYSFYVELTGISILIRD